MSRTRFCSQNNNSDPFLGTSAKHGDGSHHCHCRCGCEQMMRECLLIVQLHEEYDPFASSVYLPRKQSC